MFEIDYEQILNQLDTLIRQGSVKQVRYELKKLRRSKISRKYIFEFADLARRVQAPHLIIRWLRPIVRPEIPVYPSATIKEISIYALGLTRLGVFKEAIDLFKKLKAKNEPQVFFYLAISYIEQWDYAKAIMPLYRYIQLSTISEYQRMVGKLNYAACLVQEGYFEKAITCLNELLNLDSLKENKLLHANTLELKAQICIAKNEFDLALKELNLAAEILNNQTGQYEFFIRKWKALIQILLNPNDLSSVQTIKNEAIEENYYETVRECDFYTALATKDDTFFLRVYFSSHFKPYKLQIKKKYNWKNVIPNKLVVDLNQQKLSNYSQNQFYLIDFSKIKLTKHTKLLLEILSSDLYRPFSLPEIFGYLYPDEYFNQTGSIQKVMQIVKRLRIQLIELNVPLQIRLSKGKLSLASNQNVKLVLHNKKVSKNLDLVNKFESIEKYFGTNLFSIHDVQRTLHISKSSAQRLLNKAVEERLIKSRSGRKEIVYRFFKKIA